MPGSSGLRFRFVREPVSVRAAYAGCTFGLPLPDMEVDEEQNKKQKTAPPDSIRVYVTWQPSGALYIFFCFFGWGGGGGCSGFPCKVTDPKKSALIII